MSSHTILKEPTGLITPAASLPLLRLRSHENIIAEAFAAATKAENQYMKALESIAAIRGGSVEILLDQYRLQAEAILDRGLTLNPQLPKEEAHVLTHALAAVTAWRAMTDAVYYTIVADRGHAGRAHAALLNNSGVKNIRFKNTLRSYKVKSKFLTRNARPENRRAVPDIDESTILLIHLLDKEKRFTIPFKDGSMKIDTLKGEISKRHSIPVRNIKLTLGNRELCGDYSLAQWHVLGGTVIFFDERVLPEEEPPEDEDIESSDSDEGLPL